MGRYAIIGLGSLGQQVAKELVKQGQEVIALDKNESSVKKAGSFCAQAILVDVTDKNSLKSIKLGKIDAAFLSLGGRLDASILATLYLKEMGISRIVAKALNEDQEKILLKIGATMVVVPKREMAAKLARTLISPNVLEIIPIGPGYSILETAAPAGLIGKTLSKAKLRSKHGVEVVLIKDTLTEELEIPTADKVLKDSDILIMVGKDADLKKVEKI